VRLRAFASGGATLLMHPLLIILVVVLGLGLIKVLADRDRARRGRVLRGLTAVVIVTVAVLLSLRMRQYWIALLSFAWLLVERRLFDAVAARMGGAKAAGSGEPSVAPGRRMSRAEALSVLGLEEGASEEAIQAAYRELMKRVHPDRGGSDYLAAKLNQAKDVLTS
jgi:hypothetical protein